LTSWGWARYCSKHVHVEERNICASNWSLAKVIIITLQHTSCYHFRASLLHHQGAHNCIKHWLFTFYAGRRDAENSSVSNTCTYIHTVCSRRSCAPKSIKFKTINYEGYLNVINYVKFVNAQQANKVYDFKNVKFETLFTVNWSKKLNYVPFSFSSFTNYVYSIKKQSSLVSINIDQCRLLSITIANSHTKPPTQSTNNILRFSIEAPIIFVQL
jgi:hypothetical protein